MPTYKHRLAINADDYGPHPFVNQGVLNAIDANIISSVSVLANKYQSGTYKYNCPDEVQRLIDKIGDKNIGIGVHLSLTSGGPLTKSKDLIIVNKIKPVKGKFHKIHHMKLGKHATHLQAIEDEIEAQITMVQNVLIKNGITLDHVNSHHNLVTLYDRYHKRLLKVLKRMGIEVGVRNPMPISKDDKYEDLYKGSWKFHDSEMRRNGIWTGIRLADNNIKILGDVKKSISEDAMIERRKITAKTHICADVLIDGFYGQPSDVILDNTIRLFKESKRKMKGEFVVHLGAGDLHSGLEFHGIKSDYMPKRKKELGVLFAYGIHEALEEANIQLAPMSKW